MRKSALALSFGSCVAEGRLVMCVGAYGRAECAAAAAAALRLLPYGTIDSMVPTKLQCMKVMHCLPGVHGPIMLAAVLLLL
jgi:hypothetical protein